MNNTLSEAAHTPRFNTSRDIGSKDPKGAGNSVSDTSVQLASTGFDSTQITSVLEKARGNLPQRPWEAAEAWKPVIDKPVRPGIEIKPGIEVKPGLIDNIKPGLIDIIKPGIVIPVKPHPGFPLPGKPVFPQPEVQLADPGLTDAHNNANADGNPFNDVAFTDVDGEIVVDGVELTDVDQGAVANCYLCAALGSIALHNPDYIKNMITDNGNGTYTVSFGGEWGDVTIDDDFATFNDGTAAYASFGDMSNPELWVSIIEKAYVQANRNTENGNVRDGTYQGIGWGNSSTAIENITGQASTTSIPSANTPESLKLALNNGQSVVLSSLDSNGGKKARTPDGLVTSHAYVLQDVRQNDKGEWEVVVYNPWRSDGDNGAADGNNDGFRVLSMEQFNANFRGVEITNEPVG